MWQRSRISSLTSVLVLLCAATAHAQVGSFCLRPLGIPDKWIEMQTPPWDPTDTFDPTGPNPDIYDMVSTGYNPLEDHGRPMSLVLYNRIDPLQGQSAWPIAVGDPGGSGFFDAIVSCAGYPHGAGESFPSLSPSLSGPFGTGFSTLIAQDPDARWDPSANDGRGGVVGSAFAQSPRVIALPVFAPDSYGAAGAMSPPMIRIVGFFVAERLKDSVRGYLTTAAELTVQPVTARAGDYAPLSASLTGPGSPLMGVPIEFLHDGQVIATAQTDGTGTARPSTTSFKADLWPGTYPGAIRARIQEFSSFLLADEAKGDVTVLKKLPLIAWQPPSEITYGTPLGAAHLNATADIAGEFTYSPGPGVVLPATYAGPAVLTVSFVPAADQSELYEGAEATAYMNVLPAPLTVRVNDTAKLYLDPLPAFTISAAGLVNGDDLSVIGVSSEFVTAATGSSPVGSYTVLPAWVSSANYDVSLRAGMLTIVPRPTATLLQSSASASIYGQAVSFTVAVSSERGVPGGTVTLLRGDWPVGSATLADGRAVITAVLDAGTHGLTAQYSGGEGFAGSASNAVAHVVQAASTVTSLSTSVNPSRTGQPVTFTAVVTPVAPGGGSPSGVVEFLRNGAVVGSAPVASGIARFTIDTLAAGKHDIQARYVGSTNHRPSVSGVVQQSVKGGGK